MQAGTLVAGKYRVERVIGRGGMGLVVEATHIHLGHRVALKFLADEMLEEQTAVARFNREARASATLKGEHICRVSDFGVEGKAPYIVMELLVGTDLARLSKVRVLDVATTALYIRQACIGLAEAHAAGIIHRDLKPGNLFLTRRGDGSPLIKILDFGVAKAPIGENDVKLTGTSNVVGSPGFMSPEQFRSSKSVDARADIWALGVILYKLVSGRLPFKADGFAEFALAISRDAMPPLTEAPPPFAAIVARCLEKDPAKRYADVTALAEALKPFAAGARPSAQQMTVPPSEPVDVSGIGGEDGPDTSNRTQVLGGGMPAPVKPAIAKVPAMIKVPSPAGVPVVAPAQPRATPPPPEIKQTVLGVATAEPAAAARPSKQQTSVTPPSGTPQQTIAGVAVAAPARFVPLGELPPGTPVGEYLIEKKIGEGGMGVVYSAMHPMIGKRAAIKVIGADLGENAIVVERFVQEARSVNQIGHPNIVDVFAFGKLSDGRNYFVMEYLQGESLRERLYRAFMSIPDAIQILDEIANALEAAHEKQIVHRDLKPDNVYLASVRGGFINVKLLDFGIAKLVTEGGSQKTRDGEMMGTPAYLSPEQARGKGVDHRTDIYALGVMMYEMITGRLPFIAESAMDIVVMHLTATPQRARELKPDLPPLLEQTVMDMLEKEPDRRPTLTHIRNVFAELVATGQVQMEASSTATFRSDLRRPASSPRHPASPATRVTPQPQPTVLPLEDDPSSSGRRRNNSPSEAPTGIAFVPGSDVLTPSNYQRTEVVAASAPKKSRLALVLVLAVVGIAAGAIAFVMVSQQEGGEPARQETGSAGVVAVVTPVDAAAIALATPDAAVAAVADANESAVDAASVREITIQTDPAATVFVDGSPVAVKQGTATVSLADGAHQVVISAAGRVTVDKSFEVSAATTQLAVKLERAPKVRVTTKGTHEKQTPGAGSGSAKPAFTDKNATVDPFAQ